MDIWHSYDAYNILPKQSQHFLYPMSLSAFFFAM